MIHRNVILKTTSMLLAGVLSSTNLPGWDNRAGREAFGCGRGSIPKPASSDGESSPRVLRTRLGS
jgi:hypothetical protein